MNKVPRIVWTLLACVFCIVVTAACCLLIGDNSITSDKYLEVIQALEDNSVYEIDAVSLQDASASAIVSSLDDSWSYYMSPEDYAEYQLYASNEFVGIGVTTAYNSKYGYLYVTSVTEKSPAALAQIEVGNMITAVNGTDISSFTPDDLEGYLKSFGEDEFELSLLNAQGGVRSVRLACQIIYLSPVTWELLEDGVIGYIKISNFEAGCGDAVKAAIEYLKKEGARSLIFDVRDNPGGLVTELKNVLDLLLPKGDLFICRDKLGREVVYSSDSAHEELPMVVTVNTASENEAEMFAAVIQNFGAATVVGQRTSGNGHNQIIVELSDKSAVRISRYVYLTAERKDLQTLGGVVPDIKSSPFEDSSLDVILEAAKDVVS